MACSLHDLSLCSSKRQLAEEEQMEQPQQRRECSSYLAMTATQEFVVPAQHSNTSNVRRGIIGVNTSNKRQQVLGMQTAGSPRSMPMTSLASRDVEELHQARQHEQQHQISELPP